MAEVFPMRALRYNPELVRHEDVVAPPYDVISPALHEELYQASPYNIIRLELGKEEPGDDEARNRYTRQRKPLTRGGKKGSDPG